MHTRNVSDLYPFFLDGLGSWDQEREEPQCIHVMKCLQSNEKKKKFN